MLTVLFTLQNKQKGKEKLSQKVYLELLEFIHGDKKDWIGKISHHYSVISYH